MRTPPHFVAYRSVTMAVTAVILLLLAAGLAGYGPLSGLHQFAQPVSRALHLDTISG